MSKMGRLTLKKMGFSMPTDAPAYQAPPYHYRNVQSIAVAFETDPDVALEAIPAPLVLPEPAIAALSFYWYPFSTFGPYHEAIISLNVEHDGKPLTLIQKIMVDTEPPMLAGRELWGFPKKLATIGLKRDRDMIFGTLERPAGHRIASALVRPEQPMKEFPAGITAASLRVIPAADANPQQPAIAEIIATPTTTKVHEGWEGTGSVSFAENSVFDPWNQFPVKKIVAATYMEYDMFLPAGKVLAKL
jgi:acetoacetate decarboxylase